MAGIIVSPVLLRRYFYEIVLLGLVTAVVFLFWEVLSLHKYIRNDLINGNLQMTKALERNTSVVQENTYTLKQTQYLFTSKQSQE
jgi:hypothetical protein